MAEIVTLTLHPCVDRTIFPDGTYTEQSGGKGVNVARVLRTLGVDCAAIAPFGGPTGARFRELALSEGVPLRGVHVATDTRRIDTCCDSDFHTQRVVYRRGEDALPGEVQALRETLADAGAGARLLMLCGSAPGPLLAAFAKEAIGIARDAGARTFVDSSGDALREAYAAGPDLLKFNRSECMQLAGMDIPAGEEERVAESLRNAQTAGVIVTLGESGALWAREGGTIFCPAPECETVNAVGSGDSFAAALIWALLGGMSDQGALAVACAAGAANARVFPAARIGRSDIESVWGAAIPI